MNENQAVKIAKKYIKSQPMPSSFANEFKNHGLSYLMDGVVQRTAELIKDNQDAGKSKMEHLGQILPCIAFYEALLVKEGNREQALQLFERWCFIKIEKMAKWIPVVMKIPKLYKMVPKLMRTLLDSKFGHAAGFDYVERECKNGFAVDMTMCPYVEACEKYGCPELTKFFCISDDICYGNMHPNLIWDRSKTLGTGGDCCDFKMYIKD